MPALYWGKEERLSRSTVKACPWKLLLNKARTIITFHAFFPLFLPLCHLQHMQICPYSSTAEHQPPRSVSPHCSPVRPALASRHQLASVAYQQRAKKVCRSFHSPACFPRRNACLHKLSPALHIPLLPPSSAEQPDALRTSRLPALLIPYTS